MIDSAHEGIFMADAGGLIRVWNRLMEQLTGIPADAAIGAAATEIFSERRLPGFAEALARALGGESQLAPDCFVTIPETRRELWVSYRLSPFQIHPPKTEGAIITMSDISERKRLEQRLIHIVEEEKLRISQDLHDDLGQQITAISLMLDSARNKSRSSGKPMPEEIERAAALLAEAHGGIRGIVRGLQPVAPGPRGLMDALERLAHQEQGSSRAEVHFLCRRTVTVDNPTAAVQLFRIAKEAVNNAVKHAHARHIIVELRRRGNEVTLHVKDDGRGLDAAAPAAESAGAGLRIMRYRAESIGGHLAIASVRPHGTLVTCRLRLGNACLASK